MSEHPQRTHNDQKVLFTALGFLAVVLKGEPVADQAERALAIAGLIESFCRLHVPEAFGDVSAPVDVSTRDRMVSVISEIMKADGRCSRHELCDHDFSDDDIERYWNMAYALACVSLNLKRRLS